MATVVLDTALPDCTFVLGHGLGSAIVEGGKVEVDERALSIPELMERLQVTALQVPAEAEEESEE